MHINSSNIITITSLIIEYVELIYRQTETEMLQL